MVTTRITANFRGQNRKHPKKFFNKRATADAERAALRQAKDEALKLYRKTVTSWNFPPQFSARRTKAGWSILVSDLRYRYLDQGTAVRYATMTRGYKPKTKVGVFYSYKGAGRLAYVSKSVPRPGIEARGWTEKVNERVTQIIHRVYREKLHTNWVND